MTHHTVCYLARGVSEVVLLCYWLAHMNLSGFTLFQCLIFLSLMPNSPHQVSLCPFSWWAKPSLKNFNSTYRLYELCLKSNQPQIISTHYRLTAKVPWLKWAVACGCLLLYCVTFFLVVIQLFCTWFAHHVQNIVNCAGSTIMALMYFSLFNNDTNLNTWLRQM